MVDVKNNLTQSNQKQLPLSAQFFCRLNSLKWSNQEKIGKNKPKPSYVNLKLQSLSHKKDFEPELQTPRLTLQISRKIASFQKRTKEHVKFP